VISPKRRRRSKRRSGSDQKYTQDAQRSAPHASMLGSTAPKSPTNTVLGGVQLLERRWCRTF
jgi:hypothetical protein